MTFLLGGAVMAAVAGVLLPSCRLADPTSGRA
jgi:branched-subunit amino acid ABC-type transport system permease component